MIDSELPQIGDQTKFGNDRDIVKLVNRICDGRYKLFLVGHRALCRCQGANALSGAKRTDAGDFLGALGAGYCN